MEFKRDYDENFYNLIKIYEDELKSVKNKLKKIFSFQILNFN
jgi:hypothetical protein